MAEAASGFEGLRSLSLRLANSAAKLETIFQGLQHDGPERLRGTVFEIETLSHILLQIEQDRQANAGQCDDAIVQRCLEICRQGVDRIGSATSELESAPRLDDAHALALCGELESAKSTLAAAYGLYAESRSTSDSRRAIYNVSGSTSYRQMFISGNARVHNGHVYGNVTNYFYTDRLSQAHGQNLQNATSVPTDGKQRHTESKKSQAGPTSLRKSLARVAGNRIREVRGGRRRSFALRLPRWLVSKTWSVSLWQSANGWDVSLRSYNLVKSTAPIARLCERGDWAGVLELIQEGKASPHDYWYGGLYRWMLQTPFKLACVDGELDFARYLQSLGASADMPNWGLYPVQRLYPEFIQVLRLLVQEFGVETETLLTDEGLYAWQNIRDVEGAKLLRDGFGVPYQTLPFQERFSYAMALDINAKSDVFHEVLGEPASTADLLLVREIKGGTIVHFVAKKLSRTYREPDHSFLALLVEAVSAGVDVSQTNLLGETALSAVIGGHCRRIPGISRTEVASLSADKRNFLLLWTCWLHMAGTDLLSYAEHERTYFSGQWQVTYGPEPEDWDLCVSPLIDIPIWRPQMPPMVPGSWPVVQTASLPTVLPWRPTPDDFASFPPWAQYLSAWEKDSRPILRSPIAADGDDLMSWSARQQMLMSSQDDTGLVQRLMNRRHNCVARRPRSSSQPPPERLLFCRGGLEHCVYTGRSWLGYYHCCSLDGRWRLSSDDREWPRMCLGREKGNCRTCIRGVQCIDERWNSIIEQMFLFRKLFSSWDELHDLPYAAYREQYREDCELYDLGWDGCKRALYGID